MRNKLEEINLAIFAVKYGEDAAIRIADSFSDEEIIDAKKLIKSKKCREAIDKRWGKKIEVVQAPEPVAVQPTPAPVQEEVQSQELIPVIGEAPADYVDPIQKKANEVVNRLEHQTYTAKSIPVQPKTDDNALENALSGLGIDPTQKTGCLGDDWDSNKLLTEEMKQDMRELGLDKVPKNYGQPYDFQFNREKHEAFVTKYSSPQTASLFMTLTNGFEDTY